MSLDGALKAALVTVMVKTRDWSPKACADHIDKLEHVGRGATPDSFARVVGNYVSAKDENGGYRYTSPALLAERGIHWDKTEVASRKLPPKCPDHDEHFPCQACEDEKTPPPEDFRKTYQQTRQAHLKERREAQQQIRARQEQAREEQARRKARQLTTERTTS